MTARAISPSRRRRIALLGALALAVAIPVASIIADGAAQRASGESLLPVILAAAVLGLSSAIVGVVILWRASANVIGAMLVVGGLLVMSIFLGYSVAAVRYVEYPETPDPIGFIASAWGAIVGLPAIFLLFPGIGTLFPDGRVPGRNWRLPFAGVIALVLVSTMFRTVAVLTDWLPEDFESPIVDISAVFLSFGLAVGAVIVRYRRSEGVERAQLKWFVASVAIVAIAIPISLDGEASQLVVAVGIIAGSVVPIAIGIAILRYRLYEIDRIISRTIAYAVLTAVLVAVYAAGVIGIQAGLASFTTSGGPIAVAGSTLAVFALFQPLRRRLQGAMDRRFNRSRYDAQRTIDTFAARLRDEVDSDRLSAELRTVVRTSLAPASVAVWLRHAAPGFRR